MIYRVENSRIVEEVKALEITIDGDRCMVEVYHDEVITYLDWNADIIKGDEDEIDPEVMQRRAVEAAIAGKKYAGVVSVVWIDRD